VTAVTDTIRLQQVRQPGLSSAEAARLLAEAGPNALAEAKPPSHVRRFAANLVHLFALLLWGGALLALLGGLPELSAAIVAVILVNAAFAFVQEYRAEKAVEALRGMLPVRVRVRRDGVTTEIPNEEVVPGDVLLLAPGDKVAADADLLAANELRVDEATLTGESYPVVPAGRVRREWRRGSGRSPTSPSGPRTSAARSSASSTASPASSPRSRSGSAPSSSWSPGCSA
jgi:magnesium-transporting ATPase (P-type)